MGSINLRSQHEAEILLNRNPISQAACCPKSYAEKVAFVANTLMHQDTEVHQRHTHTPQDRSMCTAMHGHPFMVIYTLVHKSIHRHSCHIHRRPEHRQPPSPHQYTHMPETSGDSLGSSRQAGSTRKHHHLPPSPLLPQVSICLHRVGVSSGRRDAVAAPALPVLGVSVQFLGSSLFLVSPDSCLHAVPKTFLFSHSFNPRRALSSPRASSPPLLASANFSIHFSLGFTYACKAI